MPFIDYYYKPRLKYDSPSRGIEAQLRNNNPAFLCDGSFYMAFCVIDFNLQPLNEEILAPEYMRPDIIPAKFTIAMKSSNFSWCRLAHCLVFVLALSDEYYNTHLPELVETYSARAGDFLTIIETDFGINLSVSVSNPFTSLDDFEDSVRDALVRVDFACYVEERVSVVDSVFHQEMQRLLARKYPEYKLVNYERPIIAAALSRNFLHAELVLVNYVIAHLCDPIRVFPTMNTTILNMCRVITALSCVDPWVFVENAPNVGESIENIRICTSLSEMKHHIHQYFLGLQEATKEVEKFVTISSKVQQIIEFVHGNYKNPLFSAVMVSDTFDINPAYLSRIFKEQAGINLLTYVQTLRIAEAKDLLQHTEMTIERIAAQVGYNSALNLHRLFKKYEGVSPSEYRVILRGVEKLSATKL